MTNLVSRIEYSHLTPGTPEARWLACPEWADAPDAAGLLRGVTRIVVLSAHPDDETLGVGGLAAYAHLMGLSVHLILATDGEGSHPHSPTTTPAELAHRRAAEYDAAITLLTPGARQARLGLPDGALAAHRPALEHALGVMLRTTAGGPVPGGGGAGRVLLLAPWRGDGHPDHEAAGQAAVAAAAATGPHVRVAEYPIWLWHWGEPSDVPWAQAWTLALPEPVRRAKAAAVREHRSQVEPLSQAAGDEPILHPAALARFARPFEVVFAART